MSLYNVLFGMNPSADLIVALLNLTRDEVPRFRDAWVEKREDDYEIRLHTRMGGGNAGHWDYWEGRSEGGRDCECPGCVMEFRMFEHPQYLRHADDDFDSTYRDVWFRVKPEHVELAELLAEPEKVDIPDRWVKQIEAMERGEISPEVREVLAGLVEQIGKAFDESPK